MKPSISDRTSGAAKWHSGLPRWTLIGLALLITTTGCALYDLGDLTQDPIVSDHQSKNKVIQMIEYRADTLTLAWEPPDCDCVDSPIKGYLVLVRPLDSSRWRRIGTAGADPHPRYSVRHSDLGDGRFVFGVVAVDELDLESDVHSSLDRTAVPGSGWYVRWKTN